MKSFALEIEGAFSGFHKSLEATESRSSIDSIQSAESKQRGQKLKQAMECPMDAWRLFRSGKMIAASELCSATLDLIRQERPLLLSLATRALVNCVETQIASVLKQIRAESIKVFHEVPRSFEEVGTRHAELKEALLLNSGLYSKTHYTEGDLLSAFTSTWEALSAGKATGRPNVLHNCELLVFGCSAITEKSQERLCSLFADKIRAESPTELIELLMEASTALACDGKIAQFLAHKSRQLFAQWARSAWSAIDMRDSAMQTFEFSALILKALQKSHVQFMEHFEEARAIAAPLGDFNLLLAPLFPNQAALPEEYTNEPRIHTNV